MATKSKSVSAALTLALGAALALGCSAQVQVETPKKEPAPKVVAAPEKPKPEAPKPAYIDISDRIQFETGQAILLPSSQDTLDEVAAVLKSNAHIKMVEIEGHTDATGRSDMNLLLSQSRAEAVRDYLVRVHQIDRSRLVPRGYGQENPVADNVTWAGREQNRRVEFRIVNQGG